MSLIDRLRAACLSRGVNGIKSFGCSFRIFDESGDRLLDINELAAALRDYKVNFQPDELRALFQQMDKTKSGTIDFDEFLRALRPQLNQFRLNLILKAFAKMDENHDGIITVEDLRDVYNAKKNPKYLSGVMSEDDIFREFLNSFDPEDHPDGKITKDNFIDYYAGVSASIDDDLYFELMIVNSWHL